MMAIAGSVMRVTVTGTEFPSMHEYDAISRDA